MGRAWSLFQSSCCCGLSEDEKCKNLCLKLFLAEELCSTFHVKSHLKRHATTNALTLHKPTNFDAIQNK